VMIRDLKSKMARRLTHLAAAGLLVGIGACGFEDPLRVADPGTLTDDELAGVGSVEATVNGMIGAYAEAQDDYALYSGMFTDEFILAGTFPTRLEVDDRRMVRDNATVTGAVYEPIHVARALADNSVASFEEGLTNPDLASVVDLLQEGIALGYLYGGYTRILLSELYCESALDAGEYVLSNARAQEAIDLLGNVAAAAATAGRDDVADAALVGIARANLFLGNDGAAMAAAQGVSGGFEPFLAEFSENANVQFNEVHSFTWGRGGQVIRWTVGDGTTTERNSEMWPYFAEWEALGLIDPDPGLTAFNANIPVKLQTIYDTGNSAILVASPAEADMIEAEVLIRSGAAADLDAASTIVNGYRAGHGLADIDFAGMANLTARLQALVQEKARETWLSGTRQGDLRRLRERDGIDMYPAGSADSFDQICFPVPQQEIDNNTNTSRCTVQGVCS